MHAASQHMAVDRQRFVDAAPSIMAELISERLTPEREVPATGELAVR
jgi:hypothetical protein